MHMASSGRVWSLALRAFLPIRLSLTRPRWPKRDVFACKLAAPSLTLHGHYSGVSMYRLLMSTQALHLSINGLLIASRSAQHPASC